MTNILTSLLTFFRLVSETIDLADATLETSPTYLTPQESHMQALAAVMAATPEIPAEVLLGLGWVESRYNSRSVSRVEQGVRKTGVPNWKSPPRGTFSYFCGVTQASAGNSWKKCQTLRDVFVAYRTAVVELNEWLAPRVCNHNLRCALTGYNGGFQAIKTGTRYYAFVMYRTRLIRAALIKKEKNDDRYLGSGCSRTDRPPGHQTCSDGPSSPRKKETSHVGVSWRKSGNWGNSY